MHLGEIFSEEWVLAETWQAVRVAIGKFTFFDGIMMRLITFFKGIMLCLITFFNGKSFGDAGDAHCGADHGDVPSNKLPNLAFLRLSHQ